MADKADDKKATPIIVKKIIQGGGHHGGAWKVAYADFVTAMMAFFLLLWLLNVSTDEELNAISDYFSPTDPRISQATSGAGGVLGGLAMAPEGAQATNKQTLTSPQPTGTSGLTKDNTEKNKEQKAVEKAKEEMRKAEEEKFKETEKKLKEAIESDPELKDLAKNLMIDMTPEGLRIQIVDQDGEPMFASGSARMFEKTKALMTKVAEIIKKTPNELSIRGHTDSVPYGKGADYTNWELSSDRANATRRVLKESGIEEERLNNVVGKADTEHLFPDEPNDARNRRISVILLKEELTNPDFEEEAKAVAEEKGYDLEFEEESETTAPDQGQGSGGTPQIPIGTFRRTPGAVEFP